MAKKKSFKSLPRKAQKAAFAQMDDDGTRRGGVKKASGKNPGGLSVAVKASSTRLPHLKTADQKRTLAHTTAQFKAKGADRDRQLSGLDFGITRAKKELRTPGGEKERAKEFLSTARAFRIKNKLK